MKWEKNNQLRAKQGIRGKRNIEKPEKRKQKINYKFISNYNECKWTKNFSKKIQRLSEQIGIKKSKYAVL